MAVAGQLERAADAESAPGVDGRWWMAAGTLVVVGTVLRLHQLTRDLAEWYSFRQTQTSFLVREYAAGTPNPFVSPLPVFGVDSDVPMEFPIIQVLVSLVTRLGPAADTTMRVTALIGFHASAVLIGVLLSRWVGRIEGLVALALMQFSPFGLVWGAAALIDYPSAALALGMVLALDSYLHSGANRWLVVGALAGAVAGLVKITTMPVYVPLLVVAIVLARDHVAAHPLRRRAVASVLAGPGLAVLAAFAWTLYADRVKAANPLTVFLTSANLRDWNFGTLEQRLAADSYVMLRVNLQTGMIGLLGLGLATGVLGLVSDRRRRIVAAGLALGALAGPLVFFNLYVRHIYYFIAVHPLVAAWCAVGLGVIARAGVAAWGRRSGGAAVSAGATSTGTAAAAAGLTVIYLGLALLDPRAAPSLEQFARRSTGGPPLFPIAAALAEGTQPGDRIVMVGCDWDPTYFFLADRRGLMFRTDKVPQEGVPTAAVVWTTERMSDYAYVYTCGPDPRAYLPAGTLLGATGVDSLFRLRAPGE